MTTYAERTRNLIQAGAFLKELREDTTLPEHIRKEADRLVRHYPAVIVIDTGDDEQVFRIETPWFGANLEPDWWRSYPFRNTPGR